MAIARVIKWGNGQAVRLPKRFRFKGEKITIFRRGDEIVLKEESHPMLRAFELLAGLPDDMFPARRKDDPPQRRKKIKRSHL